MDQHLRTILRAPTRRALARLVRFWVECPFPTENFLMSSGTSPKTRAIRAGLVAFDSVATIHPVPVNCRPQDLAGNESADAHPREVGSVQRTIYPAEHNRIDRNTFGSDVYESIKTPIATLSVFHPNYGRFRHADVCIPRVLGRTKRYGPRDIAIFRMRQEGVAPPDIETSALLNFPNMHSSISVHRDRWRRK